MKKPSIHFANELAERLKPFTQSLEQPKALPLKLIMQAQQAYKPTLIKSRGS
jgi:predicted DNA-binding protein